MVAENKISDTNKYTITELLGNKIKPTNERFGLLLLKENLYNNNLITNIGNIDYTKNEQKINKFKRITEPFVDNIMIVKITDSTDLVGKLLKKEICGSFNSFLRGKFSIYKLANHGVKAKLPQLLESNTKTVKGIRQIIKKDLKIIRNKYKNPVAIPYKIELADVNLETLLKDLPEILKQLRIEHYYLLDLDITQDFSGIFNKEEMIEYLTENFNFCKQGQFKKDNKIIVDNDNTVGKDCLTWLNYNSRIKIYNKFICQLTSPGINKQLGNHIINFIKCPDDRLKNTFNSDLAKNNGITRLEATIYNYINGDFQEDIEFDPLEDCINLLKQNKKYFKNAPFYSVPLHNMLIKLTNNLKNSCCIVFKNLLQYVYYGNYNTNKFTGIQIKLPENKKERLKLIKYVLSGFSFNLLPINYIYIKEDKNNLISIKQKCFIKKGKTYFSKSHTLFSTITEDINLSELGLIKTNNVIPKICRKRININSDLFPYSFKEIDPINTIFLKSIKKREKELEEINLQTRKLNYEQKLKDIQDEYKTLLETDNKIKQIENKLINYFNKQWIDLDTNGLYKLHAFLVNNINKYTYVGVLAEKDNIKKVYYLKGYHKKLFIDFNNKKELLQKTGFITIPYKNLEIIYYPLEKPFMELQTNGITTFNGNSFPKVETIKALDIFKDTPIYNLE